VPSETEASVEADMRAAGEKPEGGSRHQRRGWVVLRGRLPLWLKLSYTAFVAVLMPCFWDQHGPQNFLWACDIALFVTVAALWREDALLASSMAVAVLLPEAAWNVDFFSRLIVGRDLFGLDATGYMFDSAIPPFVRALSLFHVFLPILLLYMVCRLGYHRRALLTASILAWIVLPVSYFFTDPSRNINWVFGITEVPQTWLPGPIYLGALMALVPIILYLPVHFALRSIFGLR
jgi:hypothetical protein